VGDLPRVPQAELEPAGLNPDHPISGPRTVTAEEPEAWGRGLGTAEARLSGSATQIPTVRAWGADPGSLRSRAEPQVWGPRHLPTMQTMMSG
jgi:hypothetical protein